MNKKYGLSVRLSERTKNMSIEDKRFIRSEAEKVIKICDKKNIILNSPDKLKETSIINQIWGCIKYCENNSLTPYKVYIDLYISGGKWERKELMEMLDDFDKGLINGFVFKDLKRFSRDTILQETLLNQYRTQRGADFRLIEGQEQLEDEFIRKVLGATNELPIIEGKKNAKILYKSKQEKRLPCIPAPYGYEYNDDKNWDIIQKEAKIIKEVMKRHKKEYYLDICKNLKINKNLYYKIIRIAKKGIYSGWIVYYKKIRDLKGNVIDKKEIRYKGTFPEILDDSVAYQ